MDGDDTDALLGPRSAADDLDLDGARIQASLRSKLFGVSAPPVKIGHYELIGTLGAGGMGVVYSARDGRLGRTVALKLLHDYGECTDEQQAQLQAEAQTLARLSHPNVVQIYEVGSYDGRLYIAMEFLSGESMAAWQAEEPRPWRAVLDKYTDVGEGLAAAHAEGIVHRDLKPANLLMGSDGRVRVVDFGLAGHVLSAPTQRDGNDPQQGNDPTRSALAGTPAYMSPEQVGRAPLDARSDQYSYCVALYEALWGTRPHEGKTSLLVLEEIRLGRVTAPPRKAGVPKHITRAIMRGLSRDPAERFADMSALLAELRRSPPLTRTVAVGSCAALALGLVAWLPSQADPCANVGDEIDKSWNAGQRDSVHAAFLRTHKEYAVPAWDAVEDHVDAWARRWRSERHATCVALHVDKNESGELHDLRVRCLSRARRDIDALITVLRGGEEQTVRNAALGIAELPDLAPCQQSDTLRARGTPPADPRVAEVEGHLADAAAQSQLGGLDQAVLRASDAIALAEAVGYEPLAAEALVSRARAHQAAGSFPAALVDLERAIDHAESGGADELVVETWLLLARVAASESQNDRAEEAIRRAASALNRTDAGELQRGHLELTRAHQARWAEDFETAVSLARSSFDRVRGVLGADAPQTTIAQFEVAVILGEAGEYAEALEAFESVRDRRVALLGEHHPELAKDHYNVARTLSALGQFDRARAEVEKGLKVRPHPGAMLDVTLINLHLQLFQLAAINKDHPEQSKRIKLAHSLLADLPHDHWRWILVTELRAINHAKEDEPAEALALFESVLAVYGPDAATTQDNYWVVRTGEAAALHALGRLSLARSKYVQLLADLPVAKTDLERDRHETWREAIAQIDAELVARPVP